MSAYTDGVSDKTYTDADDLRLRAQALLKEAKTHQTNRHIETAKGKADTCLTFCYASDSWYPRSLDRCETYRYLAQEILDEAEETFQWILSVPPTLRAQIYIRQNPVCVTRRTLLALYKIVDMDVKAGSTDNLVQYLARSHANAHPQKLATLRTLHALGVASAQKWTQEELIARVGAQVAARIES